MAWYQIGDSIPLTFIRNVAGTPVPGLSVNVNVQNASDGTSLLASTAMTEVSSGLYVYVWASPPITTKTDIVVTYTVVSDGYQTEEFHTVTSLPSSGGGGSSGGVFLNVNVAAAAIQVQVAAASIEVTVQAQAILAQAVAAAVAVQTAAAAMAVEAGSKAARVTTVASAIETTTAAASIEVALDC